MSPKELVSRVRFSALEISTPFMMMMIEHDSPASFRLLRKPVLLILSITALAYAGTLGFQFVYDDIEQIVNNSAVHSWAHVGDYFCHDVWYGRNPIGAATNYYRSEISL